MAETKFGFALEGIGAALEGRRLAVPIYQRSYAWGDDDHGRERDQVREYWTDLRTTFSDSDAEYFLGTVVLSKEGVPGRVSVIDGQQRLATTAVLIAAIRDEFKARGDDTRARIVESHFLTTEDRRTGDKIPQLVLNADDDAYFRSRILGGNTGTAQTQKSHTLLDKAYKTLREEVSASADDAGSQWSDRLLDWTDFLEERVRIIVVEVPTEADAFLIFETLNDRGADLTIADLLKNYLFGRAGSRLDSVRNSWIAALTNLDIAAAGSQLFTDFLRHYWSSKYGATRERELYARIKERITTSTNAVDFADELQQASRFYAAIMNSDHDLWSVYGTSGKTNVDVLGILNLEQNRPLLLAALQHFGTADLAKLLRSLIAWSVRGLIVGGIGGGTTERVYCDAAVKIRSGSVKSTAEVAVELASIIPGDEQFEAGFATARITRGTLARYLLNALERTKLGSPEPELVPNADEGQVNLEHVLPKNPTGSEWPQFSPDQHRANLHRLGNLALLAKGPNDRVGNKPFAHKQPILSASKLILTQDAGAQADWTPTVISDRQKRLAELAKTTWPT